MKILAIDTSSQVCSVTIAEDNNILINLNNDDEKTHSVKLMPMVDEAFKTTGLTLDNIDLLSFCTGPGSFTGVRIGIATIKAFADVKNIPIVGVSSLESLAYNVKQNCDNNTLVCSLIDAKNNNVYCGLYNFSDGDCTLLEMMGEDIDNVLNSIKNYVPKFSKFIFVGNGSEVYKNKIILEFNILANSIAVSGEVENSNINVVFASSTSNIQNGISIATAGYNKFLKGEYGNSSSLLPIYLKKSQAERTLEESIQILPLTEEDIHTISPIFASEFDEFWNIDILKNDFKNENSTYLVAKLHNEIVGFAGFLKVVDEANLMNIVTKVNKRQLGIGAKLLSAVISEAKKQNCTSITLEVNANNLPAIHLYEKFNFKRIGLRKKYYNNTDDAILMAIQI